MTPAAVRPVCSCPTTVYGSTSVHSPSRTRREDDSHPSSFVGDEVPGKGHNRRYGGHDCICDRFVKVAMKYRIGAPCHEQDSACQAEHFAVEGECKSVNYRQDGHNELGKDSAGSTACSSPQINVNKNSDVYKAQCLSHDAMPECDPEALNRKGKAIDCWLRPNVKQSKAGDIRFHDSADIPVWGCYPHAHLEFLQLVRRRRDFVCV